MSNDKEAQKRREEVRKSLLKGNAVIVGVGGTGGLKDKDTIKENEQTLEVPEGKLAFYWYEDKDLLEAEKYAMRKYFPQFKLEKLNDGRLSWIGYLENITGEGSKWYIQIIYDNDHPNNIRFGGSIKVYPILPKLEDLKEKLQESIPHVLSDSEGNLYLCTASSTDFKKGKVNTTAASALGWAFKWIAAFELWLAGDLSKSEFSAHII